jgi:hypothetical protein
MKNNPRISRWIGRSYIFLTVLMAVIFSTIALMTNLFRVPYAGIFFTLLMAFVLILLGGITYCFYKTVYVIEEGFLYSWSPFAVINLKLNDIRKIERTRVPLYFRVGADLYSGRFYILGLGWTKVVMTNLTDGVLITDKRGKHYLITPSNPDRFVKLLK